MPLVSYIQAQSKTNHKEQSNIVFFACFLSQLNQGSLRSPKIRAGYEAMQEELLQFKLQQLWASLGYLPYGAKFIALIDHPKKVYKVVKALYGLHQAPRAWYATLSTFLEKHGYRRGTIDKTLFIKKDKKDIILVQIYVDDIIFGSTKKSWSDEFEALMKRRFQMSAMGELTFFLGLQVKQSQEGIFISQDKYDCSNPEDVDIVMCEYCSTPMETKALLWLKMKELLNLDRKSTRLVQPIFLEGRLISCSAKSRQERATSTTEAEYVAAASCCGQVLWLQNQLLDYGFNFMNTIIHIDNQSTICIIKNPVYHSKTKHIEIRHHFIRDCYEKKLIQVQKIHTDLNVKQSVNQSSLMVQRFNFLLVNIGMVYLELERMMQGLQLDMKKDMPAVTC
ncbi:putative ribonuclease H-like domain-containing protein [Tanacetum coccineum]